SVSICLHSIIHRRLPSSPLFPYTTLFRSQTTIDRPFIFAFEDEGGILPVHNVGLSASGQIPSGRLGLRYIAEIGNGRTSRSPLRSEEHTSELQSREELVCRLLLEKKKNSTLGSCTGGEAWVNATDYMLTILHRCTV